MSHGIAHLATYVATARVYVQSHGCSCDQTVSLQAGCVTAHVTEGGSHAKAVTWWAVSCAGETTLGYLASPNPR